MLRYRRRMDVVHTAAAQATNSEPFECSKCDYKGVAYTVVVGVASVSQGGALFGNERAGEMARDAAEARAWQNAMSDVAMAPCPQCGAVDRKAWLSWMTKPDFASKMLIGVLTFAMGCLLSVAIFSAQNLFTMVCVGVLVPFLLGAGVLLTVLPFVGKRTSTRKVRFEPPPRGRA